MVIQKVFKKKNKWNDIIIETDHFSYFLLVWVDKDGNLLLNNNWNNSWNNSFTIENTTKNQYSWWWGWVRLVKDNCPYGDFSESYYDKTCGFDPYYEWAMSNINKNIDKRLISIRWDLSMLSSEDDKYNKLINDLLDKDVFDDAVMNVFTSLIKTKYIWLYKLLYLDNKKYIRYNKAFEKLTNFILSKKYKDVWFKARFMDDLDAFIIYFAVYKENPKLRKQLKNILILKAKELDKMYKRNVLPSSKNIKKVSNIKKIHIIKKENNEVKITKKKNKNIIKEKINHKKIKSIKKEQTEFNILKDIYLVAIHSIKLKADPYWKRTNAYLYNWDIVQQLTQLHPKWFFKVRVIKSKYKKYEWKEWYIFRKYLRKVK